MHNSKKETLCEKNVKKRVLDLEDTFFTFTAPFDLKNRISSFQISLLRKLSKRCKRHIFRILRFWLVFKNDNMMFNFMEWDDDQCLTLLRMLPPL